MHTPFTPWINFLHVQMICTTDLHYCVNSYIVIILYVFYAFDMLHILLSGDSLRDLWNVCVYVCMKSYCCTVCFGSHYYCHNSEVKFITD